MKRKRKQFNYKISPADFQRTPLNKVKEWRQLEALMDIVKSDTSKSSSNLTNFGKITKITEKYIERKKKKLT